MEGDSYKAVFTLVVLANSGMDNLLETGLDIVRNEIVRQWPGVTTTVKGRSSESYMVRILQEDVRG